MGEQAARGRLERGGGQRAIEIRLMEPDKPEAGRGRVGTEPAERQLIGRRENDKNVRGGVPVGDDVSVGDGELERGMCRLSDLRPRRQVGASDQVEAGDKTLAMRHESNYSGHMACLIVSGCSSTRSISRPDRAAAAMWHSM